MSELLFFIIGRLSKREEVENAKTKCAGTVPLE